MNPYSLLPLPFVLQGLAMLVDEFYFHHRRGLPRWERIGHPVDTLTVLAAFTWLLVVPPSALNLGLFIGLAAFSCLVVTKDELIHRDLCPRGEMWLHAILFILHPVVFLSAGILWWQGDLAGPTHLALQLQTWILLTFLTYQIFYWNFYEPQKSRQ